MKKSFFIFFLLLISYNYAQNTKVLILGEINRIDDLTKNLEIVIFKTQYEEILKANDKLVILGSEDKVIGDLKIISYQIVNNRIMVLGEPSIDTKGLFVGQSIAIKFLKKTEPLWNNHSNIEKAPEPVSINVRDNGAMVLIPQGPFIFGSDIPGTDHYTTPIEYELTEMQKNLGKKRMRYLDLSAFYMDKYEVTVEQFKKFLNETGSEPPPGWNPQVDPGLPVSNMSFVQANEYCTWAGKRLPTELEWEKASRGPGILSSYSRKDQTIYREKINIYPTGLEFDSNVCVTRETTHMLTNVYSLKDKSYYGIYGTCGNAAEWTSSWFLPYRGNSIKNFNYGRKFKVIRGGAYNLSNKWTKGYERMTGGIPSLTTDFRAGVRCAKDNR